MTMIPHRRKIASSVEQDQFLTILSREDALARFEAALFPRAVPSETRTLADALGAALGRRHRRADRRAAVRPLQCRWFCGALGRSCRRPAKARRFGLRSTTRPSPAAPRRRCRCCRERRRRSRPAVRCRAAPTPSSWSSIPSLRDRARSTFAARSSPGQFVSYAGSDIARGEALLRAGTMIGSREIGMLAACGIADVAVARKPRVAVISTGDELVQPGEPLRPAAIYDTNGAIVAAAIERERRRGGVSRRHSRR